MGGRCYAYAITGGSVCRYHGGAAPQVLAKAEERMRALVHPAIASLQRQIDANEFQAARYVLDWAGFKAADKLEGQSDIVVRVVHEDQPLLTLNGHVDDHA
jgi:hypothetical protein